jgi:light-regulated signal transduction histidine kinase (bacteriophytochrome)
VSDPTPSADDLVLAASHDLKEPLRTLLTYTQLLQQDLGDRIPPTARADVQHIVSAARRLQEMVHDLFDAAKASREALDLKTISLDDCVDDALDELSAQIDSDGARIERAPLPDIVADRALMTDVYRNLIENALKFKLRDTAPFVRLTVEWPTDGRPVFGVADAGIGIPAEYRERVFRPFERLHGRTEYNGTGIGLAICARAIGRLGGRIWIEESVDGGTNVRFVVGRPEPGQVEAESSVEAARSVRATG